MTTAGSAGRRRVSPRESLPAPTNDDRSRSGDPLVLPAGDVAEAPRQVDEQRAVAQDGREDVGAEEAARVLAEGEAAAVDLRALPVEGEDVVGEPGAVDAE